MQLISQVCLVSVFGRGHWLAKSLASKGISVTLLEASKNMGRWAPEDWEGPFGFFKTEGLSQTQFDRLFEDEVCINPDRGFCFWLKDGPLEMKSPHVFHRLQKLQVSSVIQDYIQSTASLESIKDFSFSENWLAQFAHSFGSCDWIELSESIHAGEKQNLFSSFHFRQATRVGLEKSLQSLEASGVQVIRDVSVLDITFDDKKVGGFEIKTDRQEIFKAEQFVWSLTSEETGMLSSRIQNVFFPQGPIEPDWAWTRFRIKIKSLDGDAEMIRNQLPHHIVVIEDIMLPWAYENMMVMISTASRELFDIWLRTPCVHRFHRQRIEEQGQKICEILSDRLPRQEVTVSEFPQEASYTFSQLGPVRHPIFKDKARKQLKAKSFANLFLDSPEQWPCLGWDGNLKNQTKIFASLLDWWKKKEELRLKLDAQRAKEALEKKSGKDLS